MKIKAACFDFCEVIAERAGLGVRWPLAEWCDHALAMQTCHLVKSKELMPKCQKPRILQCEITFIRINQHAGHRIHTPHESKRIHCMKLKGSGYFRATVI
jgi:hypothetical protein